MPKGKPKKTRTERMVDEGITAINKGVAKALAKPEGEDMSDAEVSNMIAKSEKKKVEAGEKVERSVDIQEWTKQDPVIPEELAGRVWIAVFKCPNGHKTKATNRQADSGIKCAECKEAAAIVPQFLNRPTPQEDKRKKS